MCFSAEADLVAGVALSVVGIDALRHTRRPAERPLAALPLVFAAHQLVEAAVWWGLEDRISDVVWHPARWVYLAIAFGVLPILVPVAVGAIEPVSNRRRTSILTSIGTGVAVALMVAVVRGPIETQIVGHHIEYRVDLWQGGLLVLLYVVATCGSLLLSAHRHVRWFGAINLVAVGLLAWLDQTAFISLWCAWAAVTSVAIAVHLRASHPPPVSSAAAEAPVDSPSRAAEARTER
jgi:hypothetical protein